MGTLSKNRQKALRVRLPIVAGDEIELVNSIIESSVFEEDGDSQAIRVEETNRLKSTGYSIRQRDWNQFLDQHSKSSIKQNDSGPLEGMVKKALSRTKYLDYAAPEQMPMKLDVDLRSDIGFLGHTTEVLFRNKMYWEKWALQTLMGLSLVENIFCPFQVYTYDFCSINRGKVSEIICIYIERIARNHGVRLYGLSLLHGTTFFPLIFMYLAQKYINRLFKAIERRRTNIL